MFTYTSYSATLFSRNALRQCAKCGKIHELNTSTGEIEHRLRYISDSAPGAPETIRRNIKHHFRWCWHYTFFLQCGCCCSCKSFGVIFLRRRSYRHQFLEIMSFLYKSYSQLTFCTFYIAHSMALTNSGVVACAK